MRNILNRFLLTLAFTTVGTAASVAQQGGVTGRVTDKATGTALVAARVQIVGTAITGITSAEGRYRFSSVPTGPVTVRVVALGYSAVNQNVTIAEGVVSTVDFGLSLTPFSLDEFVVTATGDQARREIGNAISTIDVTDLAKTAPVQNMGDLLAARAPGVQVLPGNITGGGSRVRIRGNNSISLSNNPIYVVDGIRVWSDVNSSSIGIGGTNPSRVNDLNPEDIETIDVIKGPSAAALYGTDASNGVIVIKTKRGKAGRPVWNAFMEQGAIRDYNTYPTAYRGWRTTPSASTQSNTTQCLLDGVVARTCVQDSVTRYNLFEDPRATPNGTGNRQQYGLQVSGGSDAVQYYLSGDWEDEIGYLQMPNEFASRLRAKRTLEELPEEVERPNALTKTNLRANVTSHFGEKIDVTVNTGFVSSTQRLPQTDNNTTGLLSNGLGGPGYFRNLVDPDGSSGPTPTRDNLGYRAFTPDEFFNETVTQDINRTMLAGTANYRPTSFLSMRGVLGMDFASREDADICRRDECIPGTFGIPYLAGFKENNRTSNSVYTGDFSANANYTIPAVSELRARTTLGAQYSKERFERNGAYSWDLPGGAQTVTSGANPSAEESTTESATLGYYLEQWFGWRDKLFLTLAVRTDKNNAFGENFDRVFYPKAAVSWVINEESFFPQIGVMNSLRLRMAYGASGRQPGPNDALSFYTPSTATIDAVDTPGLVFTQVGDEGLKPEYTSEWELGLDASFASSRVNLEFTWFRKTSEDALIQRALPPSLGVATARWENLGAVRNEGIEAVLNTQILDSREVGWDLTLAGSWTSNTVLSMGEVPPIVGTTNATIVGFPINHYRMRPYTYDDTNGDGIIALSEITLGDTSVYVGPSLPRGEVTLYTGFELFNRKLRLQANIDSKFAGFQRNGTERIRCSDRLNCRGDVDPTAPLWEQARAVALRQTSNRTQFGYHEQMDFVRFREVSATWTMPDRWARLVRAQRAAVTIGGRNLGVITDYTGMDPETGYFSTVSGEQSDFQSAPPPSYWTFRLNLTF